jgi:ABC-type polar amino acid transport system ATPase subunit
MHERSGAGTSLRFNLFPHLTAVENVMLARMKAAHTPEREALERA